MEAAGDFVRAFVEFAAGVEDGEHDLEGALMLFLVHVDGDAAAVVGDGYRVVFVDCHLDVRGVAGEGFVDGVVDDFVNEVVQAAFGDVADVHCGALAHCLEAFEDGDVTGAVSLFGLLHIFF